LVLAARNTAALEEVRREAQALRAEALVATNDVTDAEQCRRAVDAAVDRFGRLDVLICSAGLSMRPYFEGSNLQRLQRVMRGNFFGTLYTTYHPLPHLNNTPRSPLPTTRLPRT